MSAMLQNASHKRKIKADAWDGIGPRTPSLRGSPARHKLHRAPVEIKNFLQGVFSCRATLKALPTATLWEAKPSPCAPPARIRLSRLQISPCLPREGREVLLLWLHIISAHRSWLPYRSPPKIRQECFVSAWVKETARLLEI